jgi:quercetin dioxygenase-like cupin family protein
MTQSFVAGADVERRPLDWGLAGWLCQPALTGSAQLAIVEATFLPGKGHAFHKHPQQEEVIYVLDGVIEQWVGMQKRVLEAGDSAFIPADTAHASFCVGDETARILAIFGPSVGEGSTTVEVAHEAPWNTLRP